MTVWRSRHEAHAAWSLSARREGAVPPVGPRGSLRSPPAGPRPARATRIARRALGLLALAAVLLGGPAAADPVAAPAAADPVAAPAAADPVAAPAAAEARGPVTGLPLPRFVSLRASEARVRRGPGLDHRVDWIYRRAGLPLQVTAEHGHWRRVEDIEGLGGWVHYSLISGARTVAVTQDMAELRRRPDGASPLVARLEAGVLASLGECRDDWCQIRADGRRGWTARSALWGS